MAVFSVLTSAKYRYWPKPYFFSGPALLLPILAVYAILWIIIIASFAWSSVYEKKYTKAVAAKNYTLYSNGVPPIRWSRLDDCSK